MTHPSPRFSPCATQAAGMSTGRGGQRVARLLHLHFARGATSSLLLEPESCLRDRVQGGCWDVVTPVRPRLLRRPLLAAGNFTELATLMA